MLFSPTLLRSRKPNDGSTGDFAAFEDHLSSSPTHESGESSLDDYHPPTECITGGNQASHTRSCVSFRLVPVTARKRTDV